MTKPTGRLKGRRPAILEGGIAGGMVTLRMTKQLHKRAAAYCLENNISLNQYGVGLIMRDLDQKKFQLPEEPQANV